MKLTASPSLPVLALAFLLSGTALTNAQSVGEKLFMDNWNGVSADADEAAFAATRSACTFKGGKGDTFASTTPAEIASVAVTAADPDDEADVLAAVVSAAIEYCNVGCDEIQAILDAAVRAAENRQSARNMADMLVNIAPDCEEMIRDYMQNEFPDIFAGGLPPLFGIDAAVSSPLGVTVGGGVPDSPEIIVEIPGDPGDPTIIITTPGS